MEKFEIDACKSWIEKDQFHIIALQIPDEDLGQIQDLIEKLTAAIAYEDIEFFLVGDGCSPCCNDLLNAQYCQAQGLIHFGHSCLALSNDDNQQTIPVFYVFYQQRLPEDAVEYLSTNKKRYSLVFYDPCYRNAIEEYSQSAPTHLIFSKINTETPMDPFNFSLYGRSVQLPIPLDPSDYSVIFISSSKASLHNFVLYFHAYDFRSFPTNPISTTKYLSKRMYAIERARNGSSYGLLISSNSLLNLPSTIHLLLDRIKVLLHKNERQYYTFLMNTLSITKLNNFEQNIDTYVLCSSCSESLWLSPEHKQFNIPLISIADVVQAFGLTDENSPLKYSFDLRQILSMIEINEENPSEFNQELVLKNPNTLLLQQRDGRQHGLENTPRWWGLQINDEQQQQQQQTIPIAELKEGRTGIAAGYTHEKS